MYVDVQKLKNSLERIAYPLYGSQPLDTVLIDQLLYCSKIQDYSQKVVNDYSGQMITLMSSLFLTLGGSKEANESALAVGNALFNLSCRKGFQSILVENGSIIQACVGILICSILPKYCSLSQIFNVGVYPWL